MTLLTDLDIPLTPGKTFSHSSLLKFIGIVLDVYLMEARLTDSTLIPGSVPFDCLHLAFLNPLSPWQPQIEYWAFLLPLVALFSDA